MRNLYVFSLALAAGLMFTPDMLALFGNSLGTVEWFFLLMTPVTLVVHLVTVHSFQLLTAPAGSHLVEFQNCLGRRSAAIIALCGKLPFAVCASAALAVTAGFVFNEVFIFWFPNFAFAFLLLGATAALNLISKTAAQKMQVVAVATVSIGLIILSGAGLSHFPGEFSVHEFKFDFNYRYLAAAFVVLIGYDLGLYAHGDDRGGSRKSGAMIAAVIAGALILFIWGLAAMSVVPLERLESSTVPYMTAARKALGQPGRYIMGTVAIAAVFSALNAMMHSVSLMTGQLANLYRDHRVYDNPTKIRPATVLLITGASASLMAMGFAGEPHLETWIRASVTLWLIYYIFVNISAIRTMSQDNASSSRKRNSAKLPLKLFSVAVLALTGTGIILLEPEPVQLLTFSVFVIAVLAGVVLLFDTILYRSR